MEKLAVENGSMISATMLGALAASEALPFAREAYERIVRGGGKERRGQPVGFRRGL